MGNAKGNAKKPITSKAKHQVNSKAKKPVTSKAMNEVNSKAKSEVNSKVKSPVNNNIKRLTKSDIQSFIKNKTKNYVIQLQRQTSLLIGLGLIALFIFIAISFYNNVTASRYRQVDMLVHSLLDYPTQTAANLIAEQDERKLQQLVDEVAKNEYVTSLNVFAANGELLSSSETDYMAKLQARQQHVDDANMRVYIKPVVLEEKQIGFLQLKFAYRDMLKTFTIFQFDATKSILLLFIILLILGIIVGATINRVHHKFRMR
jgi:uncharacterized membrane protein affecting hemolysin expression